MASVTPSSESEESNIISLDRLLPYDLSGMIFWPKILEKVGLGKEALDQAFHEVEENIGVKGDYHSITDYAPVLSFLESVIGFNGRKIVEVGPRNDGIKVLKYLDSKGADVIGLDIDMPRESTEGIRFIQDRWENLAQHVKYVDVIYAVYMETPHLGGQFNPKDFEHHIAREMANILNPNGIFMLHYLGNDYLVENFDAFNQNGFKDYFFSTIMTRPGYRTIGMHVFQKED
ncbi:hypothetical protein GF345_04155 [Candidatus Woesearchaeota archaeon]|nr:hypothetical protein [Candidatus Woesearchaeota archaeon]